MKTSKVLSVTRKADREKMASILTEQLRNARAGVTPNDLLASNYKRAICLDITTERSLSLTITLNGDSPHPDPDTFVLSWHLANLDSKERLSEAFAPGAVNTTYRHKATHVCYGFDALLATLLRCVKMAQDGSAFDPKPETIAEETVILPHVIADAVVREVELWSGAEVEARSVLVHMLTDKAETIYQNNDRFRRTIRSKGNLGRDTLYAFMRHWLTGHVKMYVNGHRLPDSFANGIKLQGRAQ